MIKYYNNDNILIKIQDNEYFKFNNLTGVWNSIENDIKSSDDEFFTLEQHPSTKTEEQLLVIHYKNLISLNNRYITDLNNKIAKLFTLEQKIDKINRKYNDEFEYRIQNYSFINAEIPYKSINYKCDYLLKKTKEDLFFIDQYGMFYLGDLELFNIKKLDIVKNIKYSRELYNNMSKKRVETIDFYLVNIHKLKTKYPETFL